MTAIEIMVCYSQFPGGGATLSQGSHRGKHQGWSGGRGSEGKRVFIVVSTGRNKCGREAGLELASANNFSRFGSMGLSPVA